MRPADLPGFIGGLSRDRQGDLNALFGGDNPSINLSGTDNFGINSSSGQLYLADTRELNFGVRPVHTLLVRTAANASVGLEASDYTVVLVTVLDTNAAPEITDLVAVHADVTVNASGRSVSVNLFEDTEVGAELARFTLTDDNPLPYPLPDFVLSSGDGQSFRVRPLEGAVAGAGSGGSGLQFRKLQGGV